jgi:hypothetical protein
MRESGRPALLSRRQILASGVAIAGTIPLLKSVRAPLPRLSPVTPRFA